MSTEDLFAMRERERELKYLIRVTRGAQARKMNLT